MENLKIGTKLRVVKDILINKNMVGETIIPKDSIVKVSERVFHNAGLTPITYKEQGYHVPVQFVSRVKRKPAKEIIGCCVVDSGRLLIIDPCLVGRIGQKSIIINKDGTANDGGVGISFPTQYGDGSYAIKAKHNEKGQITNISIDLTEKGLLK